MKIQVDKEKCIGCGVCEALAGGTFVMEDDKAVVKETVTDEKDTIDMASDACPTQAITVE